MASVAAKTATRIIARARGLGQRTLSEYDSKRVLKAYGVPTSREVLVGTLTQSRAAAKRIGYPVVLKACSADAAHKTEKGLVAVNLATAKELSDAFRTLQKRAGRGYDGDFLVQEMVKGTREVMAGMVRDDQFGPSVMFGLGGIFTETLKDVVFRVAPLKRRDVSAMLSGIRGAGMLGPVRGMKRVDKKLLGDTLIALGRIGRDHPDIAEIDINPLIVRGARPIAVDALVVLGDGPPVVAKRPGKPGKPFTDVARKFFAPKSVGVIGASATPGKPGNVVLKNIAANGYGGKVIPVNPRGGTIEGLSTVATIAELPGGIDQAIVTLPASATPATVRELGAKGIEAVVLAASGFAEVDEMGEALQAELEAAINETGVRVLGPNTTGHVSVPDHFTSSFFPLGEVPKGRVSYITQTGNFSGISLRHIMSAENHGISRSTGLGNKLDLEESDLLEYLGTDKETDAILMYLESIKNPARFLKVASKVTRDKPVILLKGGASDEGAKAAMAHTGSLAADGRILDGAMAQAGITRVDEYSDLFNTAKALAVMPPPQGNRVSFLSPSGAFTVSMTDICHTNGLAVPNLEARTTRRLQKFAPPFIRMRNPVDIFGSIGIHGYETAYSDALEAVLRDPNIDAVVAIMMLITEVGIPDCGFIVDLARKYPKKPVYVTFMGEHRHNVATKAYLEPEGVPCFMEVEQPFQVLGILARARKAMALK